MKTNDATQARTEFDEALKDLQAKKEYAETCRNRLRGAEVDLTNAESRYAKAHKTYLASLPVPRADVPCAMIYDAVNKEAP